MSKIKAKATVEEVVTEDVSENVLDENIDTLNDEKSTSTTPTDIPSTDTTTHVTIREGEAPKLRNTDELIKYAIVQVNDEVCIQLTSNIGNGLFSQEPIRITSLAERLSVQVKDKSFSSRVFHQLFKQQSNNNAGFLAAVLRHENILNTAPKKQYLHQLAVPTDKLEEHLTK